MNKKKRITSDKSYNNYKKTSIKEAQTMKINQNSRKLKN